MTTKRDYSAFDAELLHLIRTGVREFGALVGAPSLRKLASPFVTARAPEWRIIDRRLQALRKAGRIYYTPMNGWRIVKESA